MVLAKTARVLAAVALVAMLCAAPVDAQASNATVPCDNTNFCEGRGSAYTDTIGACQCVCNAPYNGYRCLYSYDTALVDCADTWHAQDQDHCVSSPQCYWNGGCLNRSSAVLRTDRVDAEPIPWCFEAFPLPFIMIVYACATMAFGFCFVSMCYMGYYYDIFSRVEDSGERVFNQYYNRTAPFVLYSVLIVLSAGALAVTSWINLNRASDCNYVIFVYIYLIVQIAPAVIVPLYYLISWIVRKIRKASDIVFRLDEKILPTTGEAREEYANTVRCFCFDKKEDPRGPKFKIM
jgi:hypothetical protein